MNHTTRTASAAVGMFVLAALAVLVFGSIWIAGADWFGAGGNEYLVRLKDSSGIQAGDRVRVAGVSAGRVRSVTLAPLDEWPVTMEITLKPEIDIKTDARAVVATEGLLGAAFLQIDPGSSTSASLPSGGEIHADRTLGMGDAMERLDEIAAGGVEVLDKVSKMLDQLSGNLSPILQNVEQMLSEENTENIRLLLASMRRTTEDAGPRITSLIERLDATVTHLDEGVGELPALMERLTSLTDGLQTAMGPDGERLAAVLDAAEASLNSAGDAFGELRGNRDEIAATLRDLRDTIANMKAFSQEIKERPSGLVWDHNPPERRPGDDVPKGDR